MASAAGRWPLAAVALGGGVPRRLLLGRADGRGPGHRLRQPAADAARGPTDGNDAADGARLALEQAGGTGGRPGGGGRVPRRRLRRRRLGPGPGRRERPHAPSQDSAHRRLHRRARLRADARLGADHERGRDRPDLAGGGRGGPDTAPAAGYPDSPDRYRPSGEATFARVVPADDVVAARRGREWRPRTALTARVVSDGTPHGDLVADEMRRAERAADCRRAGRRRDPRSGGPAPGPQAARPRPSRAGGSARMPRQRCPRAPRWRDRGHGRRRRSTRACCRRGVRGRVQRRVRPGAGPYAAYGYEAMQLALAGIEEAEGEGEFRPAIRDAVLGADSTDSVLGPFSIADEGDTTLCAVQPRRGISRLGEARAGPSAAGLDQRAAARRRWGRARRSRPRPTGSSRAAAPGRSSGGRGSRGR